jgi:hypothetical protein
MGDVGVIFHIQVRFEGVDNEELRQRFRAPKLICCELVMTWECSQSASLPAPPRHVAWPAPHGGMKKRHSLLQILVFQVGVGE